MPVAPSGRQHEISWGDQQATIVEVGGALRTYSVSGVDVLDGYAVDEMCTAARGQTLIPWPNRLRDGAYRFRDTEHQTALSEPAKHNAIHGLVRWTNFIEATRTESSIVMVQHLLASPGYPFCLDVSISYDLSDDGLRVTTTTTNIGGDAAPYGSGAHPYLRLPTPTIDPLELHAPGRSWMPTDERSIPIGLETVDDTPYDFRVPRRLSGAVLDTCFADLERDAAGRAWVRLAGAGARGAALDG